MAFTGTFTTYQEPARNDQVAVSTSSLTLSVARQAGAERKTITVRNTSPNSADVIWVTIGATTAVVGKGIQLKQGESFTDATDAGYQCWQGTITAICETVNGTTAIFER